MNRAAFAVLAALAAALCFVLSVAVVRAEALPCDGELRPRPAASWWCARPDAVVTSQGGEVWVIPAGDGEVSVVVAQGAWDAVSIDGVSVAGSRWRTWLPMAGR